MGIKGSKILASFGKGPENAPRGDAHYDPSSIVNPGDVRLPPPPGDQALASDASRPLYGHLTDPFFQRGLGRQLDKSGSDLEHVNQDQGVPARWSRNMFCPNRYATPGGHPEHPAKCDICKRNGFLYWSEEEVTVSVQPLSWEDQFYYGGATVDGRVRINFPAGKTPRKLDKVRLYDEAILYDEVLPRNKSGTRQLFKLQFEPRYLVKAAVSVRREDYPTASLPYGDSDDPYVLLWIDREQLEIVGPPSDRVVQVIGAIPPSSAITIIYYCVPEFYVESVRTMHRGFYANTPTRVIQKWDLEQIESTEGSWNISAVCALLTQRDDNEANSETYAGGPDQGPYGQHDGERMLSNVGSDISGKKEVDVE